MSVIRVRLADETEAALRSHGIAPGPFMKNAAEREVKRIFAQETLTALGALRRKMPSAKQPSEDILRRARDAG